jgi:TorA maturation chaperone TorD
MIDQTIERAQAYIFFSHALLYPQENWVEELPLLEELLQKLDVPCDADGESLPAELSLEALQAQHRAVFGLTGSLVYETELGLPHEFRQSQELADISGFYAAFGFRPGGRVHERPDHMATELEFMYVLIIKEAYARSNAMHEQAEICADAQRGFVQDHLALWAQPFCRSLQRSAQERLEGQDTASPYRRLAFLLEAFMTSEALRLEIVLPSQSSSEQTLTPFNPDYTCAGCAVAETDP